MKLIIAEKPSVAMNIARVLQIKNRKDGYLEGPDYKITWCVGHLVQLAHPEAYNENYKKWDIGYLPIIPEEFILIPSESTKKQYDIVKKLMNENSVEEIICATDAGREGQLIFEYLYTLSNSSKPVKRLWISSMTDEAIKEGFNKLRDNKEFFNLFQSAKCRSEADWIVGINATRLFSAKYNCKLTVGRVQTPTLAMIVNRKKEINSFVSEPFYEIESYCNDFSAMWFNENGTRVKDKDEAERILEKCKNKEGTITKIDTKKMSIERPLLYDLTELQRDGNRKYGYTAEETLNTAQNLYEKYKLTTYPRTDSRYLTSDMKSQLESLLNDVKLGYKDAEKWVDKILYQGINADKRVIDDKKVSDHHAIIITKNISLADKTQLNEKEKNILKLIIARFITVLDKKHEYDQTDIELQIENEKFKARGKKVTIPGWKETENALIGKMQEDEEEREIKANIKINDKMLPKDIKLLSKKTTPPKEYTEATLLTSMETAGKQIEDEQLREEMKSIGLGTPATRAGIIEKLIAVGYIQRNKKNLVPTDTGIKLIEIIPDKLKLPDLTGEWEQNLNKIVEEKVAADVFMRNIKEYTRDIIVENKDEKKGISFDNEKQSKELIGKCPRCSKNIYESDKNFYCEGFKDNPKCTFTMWKNNKFFADKGKKLTKAVAKKLLLGEKVKMTKLKSEKKGVEYDANIMLDDTGQYVNFKMEFINNKQK